MSVTLGIWKWRKGKRKKNPDTVMDRLAEDQPPDALDRFDSTTFVEKIRKHFRLTGDGDPFSVEVHDYHGLSANWIFLTIAGSIDLDLVMDLTEFADDEGLFLYLAR